MFKGLKKRIKFFKELEKHREDKILFLKTLRKYKELIKATGNKEKVKEKAREYFLVKTRFEKTRLYCYIKEDMKKIDKKVRYMMRNPKKNKLAYFFAGVYIIAPGTFELTALFLIFKYSGKYVIDIKKGKNEKVC